MTAQAPYPYVGDALLGERIVVALHRVIDPELSLDIVALGLVYGVEADARSVKVRITMTSAACPVADLIMDEVVYELQAALGEEVEVGVELVWDPPWEPARMSPRARAVMDWD